METLTSPATAMTIVSSSSSSFSIFFPKPELSPRPRIIRFPTRAKKNSSDSDVQSDSNNTSIVPFFGNQTLSQDAAMGLVLSNASVRGWTTGSGMEGPSSSAGNEDQSNTEKVSTLPWSLFTKSHVDGCVWPSLAMFAVNEPPVLSTPTLTPMALYSCSVVDAMFSTSWWII